jgi:endonuclease G
MQVKRIILLFGLLPTIALAAFESCLDQFPNKQAPAIRVEGARELCFDSFAVLYSSKTKTPVYTAERLNRERLTEAKKQQRTNRFYEEARLPSRERSLLSDYKLSGFDRGHQAPAGDMPNPNAMAQSFSLANIVPQNPDNNRETWNKIEQDTRRYVMRASGDVYVFTGPYFEPGHRTIGNGVGVPDALWKLVYDASSRKSWVHWSENKANQAIKSPITYQDFLERTNLRLLGP